MIYFDNAATTLPKPAEVVEAVTAAFGMVGNAGRGAHAVTLDTARTLYDTREKLAILFGAESPERIAFTKNATEALNIAAFGILKQGDHVITTVCEHNSVLRPLYQLEKQGVEVTYVGTDTKGNINYETLESSCKWNTKAVMITHASNLTGNVTNIARVSRFTKKYHLVLIVDAAQTAGIQQIDVASMGIDILCFTGHKGLLGPQGTGGIYVKTGVSICPLIVGGSGTHSFDKEHPGQMPTSLEAGTLNGHGIIGLGAALDYISRVGRENIYRKEIELATRFYNGIKAIPHITVYGNFEMERVPIITLNIGSYDSGSVSDALWEDYEIATRAGAHCAPLMHEALGISEQGAVRFSFSHYNTMQEVDKAIEAIASLAK